MELWLLVIKDFGPNRYTSPESFGRLVEDNIRQFAEQFDCHSLSGDFHFVGAETIFSIYSPNHLEFANCVINTITEDQYVALKFNASLFNGESIKYCIEPNHEGYYLLKCKSMICSY